MDARNLTMKGQFAAQAETSIPNPPFAGRAYRNPALTQADIEQGQQYSVVYDSARYNEVFYEATGMIREMEQYGMPRWSPLTDYPVSGFALGTNGRLYQSLLASGPGVSGVGPKDPATAGNAAYWVDYAQTIAPTTEKYDLCEFYYFRHPTLKAGFQPAQGGLLANAATLYPKAWAYLQTAEGQKLCTTETAWQAMTRAVWATLADGTQVSWNGIGGAPFYAPNTSTGALRLPDLRGMYMEAAGYDSLDVGGVHGDGIRTFTGYLGNSAVYSAIEGVFSATNQGNMSISSGSFRTRNITLDPSLAVPVANKNQPRAWGALPCVYLG